MVGATMLVMELYFSNNFMPTNPTMIPMTMVLIMCERPVMKVAEMASLLVHFSVFEIAIIGIQW
jgi:hypothetical protein